MPIADRHGMELERLVSVVQRPLASRMPVWQQSANKRRSRVIRISIGAREDVVFSGEVGALMEATFMQIKWLGISFQIRRHASPDYQTLLSSNLSWVSDKA